MPYPRARLNSTGPSVVVALQVKDAFEVRKGKLKRLDVWQFPQSGRGRLLRFWVGLCINPNRRMMTPNKRALLLPNHKAYTGLLPNTGPYCCCFLLGLMTTLPRQSKAGLGDLNTAAVHSCMTVFAALNNRLLFKPFGEVPEY